MLLRVKGLMSPIKTVDFDVYNPKFSENWQAVMDWFNKELVILEAEAKYFIDESFKTLRSSEEALTILLKFKNIKTRDSIKLQLMSKFDFILQQFLKEIYKVQDIYQVNLCI